jgi:hypothetical protein
MTKMEPLSPEQIKLMLAYEQACRQQTKLPDISSMPNYWRELVSLLQAWQLAKNGKQDELRTLIEQTNQSPYLVYLNDKLSELESKSTLEVK